MNEPVNTGELDHRDEMGRFVMGHPGMGGRPPSARNRLSEAFFGSLADDYEAEGAEAIRKWRETNPGEYAKMIAGLQQKESSVDVTRREIENLGDDQTRRMAERVLARAGRTDSN